MCAFRAGASQFRKGPDETAKAISAQAERERAAVAHRARFNFMTEGGSGIHAIQPALNSTRLTQEDFRKNSDRISTPARIPVIANPDGSLSLP